MADAKNGYLSMVFLNMHFLLYEDLSHVIVFILLFLILFIFARERERERERVHLLVHFPHMST